MAGQFSSATAGNDATAAMYQPGKILQAGGNSSGAIVIDITGAKPAVTTTASMLRQRRLATATVMADGRVLVTGGSRNWNEMTDVSYEAEIWNPASGQWTTGAVMQRARLYHSVALARFSTRHTCSRQRASRPQGPPSLLRRRWSIRAVPCRWM